MPQLVDPKTGAVEELTDFNLRPTSHTATLLPDARVLVLGGQLTPSGNTGGWIFDPRRNTFRAVREPAIARSNHTATLLGDGTVLVVGGGGPNEAKAEIFDPSTESWRDGGLTSSPRAGHGAVLLTDGRVLIYGGGNYQGGLDAIEIYNTVTGLWTGIGSIPQGGPLGPGALLPDGNVLIIEWAGDVDSWVFTADAAHWEATQPMARNRGDFSVAALPDGRVLVLGGQTGSSARNPLLLASSEAFDPTTKKWVQVAPLLEPRGGHTATVLADGSVLIIGGYGTRRSPPSPEIYRP
ncbi:MAG: hypothetical protein HY682_05790 [Chloroflexi bacterium]|nr:hypothetical protein [Chloroflexota bacterium]